MIARFRLSVGRTEVAIVSVWTGMTLTSEIGAELDALKATDHPVIINLSGGHTVKGRVEDLRTDTIVLVSSASKTIVLTEAIVSVQFGSR